VAPIHPTSINCTIGENAISQVATKAKNSFRVQKYTSVDLVCITGEHTDNAVKDHCKRLQACLFANGGDFEHLL